MFNFIKKVSRGSKTTLLLQEMLFPHIEKSSLMVQMPAKEIKELVDSLYREALMQYDFNDPKKDHSELVRVGYVLKYGLDTYGTNRSARLFVSSLWRTLTDVILEIEMSGKEARALETLKASEKKYDQIIQQGLDGFKS